MTADPARPTPADFQAAGLYDPAAPDAAGRLALLDWLAAQGASIADMQDAWRRHVLTGLAGDLTLRGGERLTLAELAARAGMSPAEIEEINRASGFPPVGPEERVFPPETAATMSAVAMGGGFFGKGPMLHLTRVLGSSVARIAEAAVALFQANVEAPIVDRGEGELALAQANLRAVQALDAIPNAVRALLRAHMEVAIRRLRSARAERTLHDTVRMTVGFVDLVGYTRLSQRLEAAALGALVERFEALASDVVAARDGRVVKLVGDALMFVAVSAAAACDIALTLLERFADDPAVTPRGGLAVGRLLARGGDYYGPAVNLASRLGDLAVPHEILATAEVAGEASGGPFRFEPAGRRILKGFDEPIALCTVARR